METTHLSLIQFAVLAEVKITDIHVCVYVILCVTDLAEGVGLPIPIEVVFESPAERRQQDLDGKTEGRSLGRRCGGRNRLGRGCTGGQSPLGHEVIAARGS